MRYLLVDRIVEWRVGEGIKGVKNVTMSEDFFDFHFPKNPIMPGVLLLEGLVQLAGWLEAASSGFQQWFLLQKVHRCMFYGFAFPGDKVELDLRVQAGPSAEPKIFSGICMVDGKKKVVAEFEGETVPLDSLEDVEDQRALFLQLTRSVTLG